MKNQIALFLIFLGSTPIWAADAKTKWTYDQHVLPILKEKCVACHNADKTRGGLDLSTYTKLMEGGASGVVVKAGDADGSRLYSMTAHKEQPYMPPQSPKIAEESIEILRNWIQQGALENAGSKAVPMKPKADVGLMSVKRGRPEGPPPMPNPTLPTDPLLTTSKANAVIALAASPWAPLVAVGGQKQILLYHGDTSNLIGVLPFSHGQIHVLKFSRNGSLLLAAGGRGGQSGKAVVYNIITGESIIEVGNETDAILAADISPDQTQITVGNSSKMLRVYSTKDGSVLREIKKHTDWIYTIEYSPDGVLLATGDRASGLFVWEANTGREFYTLRGHTAAITDVSWRDDSNVLASTSEDSTVRLWEMENGNQIKTWAAHGGGSLSVEYSHDNRLITTGRDRITKVWDQNGANQKAFPAHADVALRAVVAHDLSKIYSGDWLGQILTFALNDGKQVAQMTTNPVPLQQQLEAAVKNLEAKQQAFDVANKVYSEITPKLQQATAEAGPAQRLANDAANIAKQATDAANALKTEMDKANAAVATAQASVTAREIKVKVLTEAYQKLQAAVDANKNNAELIAAATKAKADADAAANELAAGQKLLTEAQAIAKPTTDKWNAANANATEAQAASQLAQQILAPKATNLKQLQDTNTAAKANLEKASNELNQAKAEVERLKAALAKK